MRFLVFLAFLIAFIVASSYLDTLLFDSVTAEQVGVVFITICVKLVK